MGGRARVWLTLELLDELFAKGIVGVTGVFGAGDAKNLNAGLLLKQFIQGVAFSLRQQVVLGGLEHGLLFLRGTDPERDVMGFGGGIANFHNQHGSFGSGNGLDFLHGDGVDTSGQRSYHGLVHDAIKQGIGSGV